MKSVNILSFFAILQIILNSAYAQYNENILQSASRGARVEGHFAIQLKQSELNDYLKHLKKTLENSELNLKNLVANKAAMQKKLQLVNDKIDKLSNLEMQSNSQKRKRFLLQDEQTKLLAQLSNFDFNIKQSENISKIFPKYISSLEALSKDMTNFISFLNEDIPVLSEKLKIETEKAFKIKDKIKAESKFIELYFEKEKQQALIENKQKEFGKKEEKLAALINENAQKNENSINYLKNQITYIKRNLKLLTDSMKLKEAAIKSLTVSIQNINKEVYRNKMEAPFLITEQLIN